MFDTEVSFTDEEAAEYAKQLLVAESPIEAARAACENILGEFDIKVGGRSLLMVKWLTDDPRVTSRLSDLRNSDADLTGLPSKGEFARAIWNQTKTPLDPEDKLKYFRLLGETLGYVGTKGAVEINNNNTAQLPSAPVYEVVDK
jgi:hypothetical protein